MGDKVHGTFVCEKINKIRWKPEDLVESESFVSGSWDNEENHVVLWRYPYHIEDPDVYPAKSAVVSHEGDVTEIQFINNNAFVVSSSSGCVKLLNIHVKDSGVVELKETVSWDNIHYFSWGGSSPCTALACFEDDIATVGEDGRLILLTARQKKPVCRIENADSSSLRCVCFLKHNEVLTGNLRGHMKVWDLKSSTDKPATTFMLCGEQICASCVTHHPMQRHLVLAGGEDGCVTAWDLRNSTYPVTVLKAHSDTVSELKFHPDRPEHLFTCSTNGEIWHWDTSSISQPTVFGSIQPEVVPMEENPWLNTDATKHRMEVHTLMPQLHKPINSLDVNKNRVVCGCDNEAIYVFKNVIL